MVKVKIETDEDGYITRTARAIDGTEMDDALVRRIIPGISKLDGDTLLYRCAFEVDADGYITGGGTDLAGDVDVPADELGTLVPGATKLTDGHLVVDQGKLAEMTAKAETPTPTAEQQMLASLALRVAQLQKGATA